MFNLPKIFILLYVDGTVGMADSANGPEEAMHIYEDYCNTRNLKVKSCSIFENSTT